MSHKLLIIYKGIAVRIMVTVKLSSSITDSGQGSSRFSKRGRHLGKSRARVLILLASIKALGAGWPKTKLKYVSKAIKLRHTQVTLRFDQFQVLARVTQDNIINPENHHNKIIFSLSVLTSNQGMWYWFHKTTKALKHLKKHHL